MTASYLQNNDYTPLQLRGYYKRPTKKDVDIFIELYKTGKETFKSISEKTGFSKDSIRYHLLKNGFLAKSSSEINRIYNIKETFFEEINTEESAYFLGLIAADGCVHREGNKISMVLSIIDSYLLEMFKKIINSDSNLYITKINTIVFNICSKKIYNDILSKGLGINKSLVMTDEIFNNINNNVMHHFIRGYFDGDGSVSKIKNKNGKISNRLKISFVGTYSFLEKLNNIFINNLSITKRKIYKHSKSNIYYLDISKSEDVSKIKEFEID